MGSDEEEEEDAPERRGFRDGVDLHLGAMMQLTQEGEKKRKRGRQSKKYQTKNISKYIELKVGMYENAWTCDMQI